MKKLYIIALLAVIATAFASCGSIDTNDPYFKSGYNVGYAIGSSLGGK